MLKVKNFKGIPANLLAILVSLDNVCAHLFAFCQFSER